MFNFCMKIENAKENTHNTSESRKNRAVKTKIKCRKYITSARKYRFAFDFQLSRIYNYRLNEKSLYTCRTYNIRYSGSHGDNGRK